MGMNSDGDLATMITKRQGDRESEMNNFLAGLEKKYCGSTSNKKRKTTKSKK
jgi:hypothetical protein